MPDNKGKPKELPSGIPILHYCSMDWPEHPDERLQEFRDFFEQRLTTLPDGKRAVLRSSFLAEELVRFMPGVMLMEVVWDPAFKYSRRYRFRLTGGDHRKYHRVDANINHMDKKYQGKALEMADDAFEEMFQSGAAHYWRRSSDLTGLEYQFYERVAFPLSFSGQHQDGVVGYWRWFLLSDLDQAEADAIMAEIQKGAS